MDLSNTSSIHIPSSWNRKVEKVDSETVTLPIVSRDVGTDVMENPSARCQTEQQSEERLSARGIMINENVIQLVLDALSEMEIEDHFFVRLDALKSEEKLYLVPKRTIRLEMVIVATATGEIFLILEDQILWSSDSMHNQSVTGLRWVSNQLLLSVALDGRLILSSLKSTSLEAIRSVNVTINDLPRSVRRSNASVKRAGIVAVTGNRQECFLASETGAVWSLNPDDLNVQSVGADLEGIEQFFYYSGGFVNVTSEGKIKILHKDGITSESLEVHTERPICMKQSLVVFIHQGEIVGYDVNLRKVLLRERKDLLAIDIDSNGDLVGLDSNFNICEFQFFN